MNTRHSSGAIRAILDEYQRVINDLKLTIKDITPTQLATIIDNNTDDENCVSIQSIMAHVVGSGYSYAVYIRELKQIPGVRPDKVKRADVKEYLTDLDKVFEYTCETFETIHDSDLEEFEPGKKILTKWGQVYDIEQLMEHAIVHILRHRRQIEKFICEM